MLDLGVDRKQPVIYRSGGGACLGFVKTPNDQSETRLSHFIAKGLPFDWGSDEVATFLGNLKWTALSNLSKRFKGRKRVEWFFKGSPPSNSSQTGWTYQVNDEEPWSFHILLAPPRTSNTITYHTDGPRRSAFSDQPEVSSGKGASRKGRVRTEERPRSRSPYGGRKDADSESLKGEDVQQPIEVEASPAPTQLDSQPTDSKDEASNAKSVSGPLDPIDAVRQGWKRVDQGGSGDCGWRSLADGRWWNGRLRIYKDKVPNDEDFSQFNATGNGNHLRVQSALHLKKHKEKYLPFFGQGRKGPKNFDQFVTEAAAPETWIHGATLQACAEKFGCPIIVWRKPEHGAWQRFCFASRFSGGFACAAKEECPLVICLEKQHYTSLRPPRREDIPKNWLRETAGIRTEHFGGAGKKKTTSVDDDWSSQHHGVDGISDAASSIATPSVHTCRAPSGVRGRKNEDKVSQGTPSVHSLADSELTPSVHTIGPVSSGCPLVVSPSAHLGARTPSVHTLSQNSEVKIPKVHNFHQCLGSDNPKRARTSSDSQDKGTIRGTGPSSGNVSCSASSKDVVQGTSSSSGAGPWAPLSDSWEPPVFKKGRPPQKIRKRLFLKQPDPRNPIRWSPKMPWKWKCPIVSCGWELKGTYTGVNQAKAFHVKSKHPEEDPSRFRMEQHDAPVAASPHLPLQQRGWSCPLCQAGLPELPTHAKNRAISLHCKTCHPEETPKTLSFLNRIGSVNKGSGKKQTERREQERQTLHSTHTIVKVNPVERKRDDPNWRGFVYFCSACFSKLRGQTGCKADSTCQERQQEMQSNGYVLSRKRAWWTNWINNEPETAKSFLQESGLSLEQVNMSLKVDSHTDSSLRWHSRRQQQGCKVGRLTRNPGPKKQSRHEPKLSKDQVATWRVGGSRGVRVGEASHPGPSQLTVWSLNSQGTNGAFAALRLEETPDIWLLQETWFDDNAALAFTRTARKRGYIAYTKNNKRNKGGVAVLVRKGIPQRFAACFNHLESQGIFVWVQGLFLGSIYAPPVAHGSQGAASGLVEAMAAAKVHESHMWFFGGDF